jgi:molybdopterin-guanine dinucleotide biosynthesis protein A
MVDFSVAILAGGQSSRMGTDKSFVEVQGMPIIEHLIRRVSRLDRRETFLVTNNPDAYMHLGLRMVQDVLSGKGSLGGIYTALYHSETTYTLVLACDMPFVSRPLLRYMIELCKPATHDVIVPRVEGRPQGLHAIYSKTCLGPILARLETNQNRVISFYDEVDVRYIDEPEYRRFDPDRLSFSNVNTPEDLQQARDLANGHSEEHE